MGTDLKDGLLIGDINFIIPFIILKIKQKGLKNFKDLKQKLFKTLKN